jgi:hypothetical protein
MAPVAACDAHDPCGTCAGGGDIAVVGDLDAARIAARIADDPCGAASQGLLTIKLAENRGLSHGKALIAPQTPADSLRELLEKNSFPPCARAGDSVRDAVSGKKNILRFWLIRNNFALKATYGHWCENDFSVALPISEARGRP